MKLIMANVFDNIVGAKHVVAESSMLKATGAGHILSMKCQKDLDNGSIVTRGEWIESQIFKTADYAELEAKYNELKTFKDNYDAAEIKAKKDSIFADEAYNDIRESDDFKSLMNDAEKYSVEEIQNKCDLLFAANEKKIKFSANKNKSHSISFNFSKKEDKKTSAYGNLFKKD